MKAVIVDGYIDEPASLGVPPYISPIIRATAGLLRKIGYEVHYWTIDKVRAMQAWNSFIKEDLMIVCGGIATPGKYLGGSPITPLEVCRLLSSNKNQLKILLGPIGRGYTLRGGTNARSLSIPDGVGVAEDILTLTGLLETKHVGTTYELLDELYPLGAEVIKQHPLYPDVMVEFDISRGCDRVDGNCSFCTESVFYGPFVSRSLSGIQKELRELRKVGVSAIRFGRSSNILAFGYDQSKDRPNPEAVERLLSMTQEILSPDVLHVDNANPMFIARHPMASERVISSIASHCSVGNTLSFGVESFDKEVRDANNLGGTANDIIFAIELVNRICPERVDGIPRLLPGLNLLYGLPGQSERSLRIDREYLKLILESGLLLRRVNIRRVIVFESLPIARMKRSIISRRSYEHHKSLIRENFDLPMIKKVFPVGAIIRRVFPESLKGQLTFGRPLATYPILVASPVPFETATDMVVIEHGSRSLTALPLGSNINVLALGALEYIPGIGRKLATSIILRRPFSDWNDVTERVGKAATLALQKVGISLGGKE